MPALFWNLWESGETLSVSLDYLVLFPIATSAEGQSLSGCHLNYFLKLLGFCVSFLVVWLFCFVFKSTGSSLACMSCLQEELLLEVYQLVKYESKQIWVIYPLFYKKKNYMTCWATHSVSPHLFTNSKGKKAGGKAGIGRKGWTQVLAEGETTHFC